MIDIVYNNGSVDTLEAGFEQKDLKGDQTQLSAWYYDIVRSLSISKSPSQYSIGDDGFYNYDPTIRIPIKDGKWVKRENAEKFMVTTTYSIQKVIVYTVNE